MIKCTSSEMDTVKDRCRHEDGAVLRIERSEAKVSLKVEKTQAGSYFYSLQVQLDHVLPHVVPDSVPVLPQLVHHKIL